MQALQQARDPIQRHRSQRAQRRASLREEFGALMNVLGILHAPEGGSDRPREPRHSMVAMHMQEVTSSCFSVFLTGLSLSAQSQHFSCQA